MRDLQVFPGAVTERAARVRVTGCRAPDPPLLIDPAPARPLLVTPVRPPAIWGETPCDEWVVDVKGLQPATTYTINLAPPLGHSTTAIKIRTPPTSLASEGLSIALLSCYFPSDEFVSNGHRALKCLLRRAQVPHLKVFCGDQIYADVPWAPRSEPHSLYEERYRVAWANCRLGPLLRHGGNVFTCDDHEYWNGFPDRMFYLGRSWSRSWPLWTRAGIDAVWTNQGVSNFAPKICGGADERRPWCYWQAAGVDLFVADTRTDRRSLDADRCPEQIKDGGVCVPAASRAAMSVRQRDALLAWIRGVARIGILVLGQPLAAERSSRLSFDSTLPDYPEYAQIVDALRTRIDDGGPSFIVLTGDIHWGRLTHWTSPRSGRKLVEFVSSPIARVDLHSIISSKFSVATKAETSIRPADLEALLGPWPREAVFATNENNIGMLRVWQPAGGPVTAAFQLWNLETEELADNAWYLGGPCWAVIGL